MSPVITGAGGQLGRRTAELLVTPRRDGVELARRRGVVAVVQHGVGERLVGERRAPTIPGHQCDAGRQPAAGALAAHRDARRIDVQVPGPTAAPQKSGVAVLHGGRIGILRRQPVRDRHHHAPDVERVTLRGRPRTVDAAGDHPAAVEPDQRGQNAVRRPRREEPDEQSASRSTDHVVLPGHPLVTSSGLESGRDDLVAPSPHVEERTAREPLMASHPQLLEDGETVDEPGIDPVAERGVPVHLSCSVPPGQRRSVLRRRRRRRRARWRR